MLKFALRGDSRVIKEKGTLKVIKDVIENYSLEQLLIIREHIRKIDENKEK